MKLVVDKYEKNPLDAEVEGIRLEIRFVQLNQSYLLNFWQTFERTP